MNEVKLNIAIELCKNLYKRTSPIFYYPALTGGTLYKEGERKDIDILFYSNRQQDVSKVSLLTEIIQIKELKVYEVYANWIWKAKYKGINIDIFFPEDVKVFDYNSHGENDLNDDVLEEFCYDNGIEYLQLELFKKTPELNSGRNESHVSLGIDAHNAINAARAALAKARGEA